MQSKPESQRQSCDPPDPYESAWRHFSHWIKANRFRPFNSWIAVTQSYGNVYYVSDPQDTIVLVIPIWNDSARFGRYAPFLAEALSASGLPVRWVISDDGSTEEEQAQLKRLLEDLQKIYPHIECLFAEERSRKGGAIYRAWNAYPEADWVGFVDADGAIDSPTVLRLIRSAVERGKDGGCIGVRCNSEEAPVKRPLRRVLAFRLFSFFVRCLLGFHFVDTQCGIKILPGSGYRAVANKLKESGFIFDVELLLALDLAGCRIDEIAIPWREIPRGKVRPWRDAWRMIARLWGIRRRWKAGCY